MKCFTVVSLALLGSAHAYTMPTLATRAVGRKKIGAAAAKVTPAAAPKKKVVAKKKIAAAGTKVVKPAKKTVGKPKLVKKVVTKPVKKVAPKPVKKVATKPVKASKPLKKTFTKPVKKAAGKPKFGRKVAPAKKAAPAKKVIGKKSSGPPTSGGYPSLAAGASKIQFNIATSGSAPPKGFITPNFADPRLQINRDPAVWAAAAKTRQSPLAGNVDYVFDDGLTVIERKQKAKLPAFLSGSAKSQADVSTIRNDLVADKLLFGLDADRFQLLFIAVFGLFALVGSLSGTVTF